MKKLLIVVITLLLTVGIANATGKITGLAELADTPAVGDLVEIVDVSDTSMAATGTNKKITTANLMGRETNSLETTVTGIADTEIFVGSGANAGAFVVVSGDATLANTGALTIANDAITPAKIADWYAYEVIPIAWAADGTSPPDLLDDKETRPPYQYRTFAHAADEDVNFVWFVPSDLSGTTIQFRVKYLVTAATGPSATEGVAFGLSGVSLGDNDATNSAKGTVVVVTDDDLNAAQWDILITGWSGDVTVTNLLAGEVAELALIRDVSDAVDDYAQLVGVLAIELRYVQNVAK